MGIHAIPIPCIVRPKSDPVNRRIDIHRAAFRIDPAIEPKCIFWDEYKNHDKASILAEIIQTAVEIV